MIASCVVAGLALAGVSCGDSPTGGRTVDAQVQRTLPTVQGTLLAQLCFPLEATTGQPMSARRKAQREMTALLRTLRDTPEAKVQTVRMTDQGDIREELTIRQLAERHRGGLSLIVQTVDGPAERCALAAADDLREAIKQS